jgi:hypothetical protein
VPSRPLAGDGAGLEMPVKTPKHLARWLAILLLVVSVPVFIYHPVEVIWVIAAGLFLITAGHLIFGSPGSSRTPTKKGKDRGFRNPPWT